MSLRHGSTVLHLLLVQIASTRFKSDENTKALDDELTCSVCLEQVNIGELVRSLPCFHQFHCNCIDPWLLQQGTCPICKYRVSYGWQETGEEELDAS